MIKFKKLTTIHKIGIIVIILIIDLIITFYFHNWFDDFNAIYFETFFLICIIIYWWQKKGVFIALFLSFFLYFFHDIILHTNVNISQSYIQLIYHQITFLGFSIFLYFIFKKNNSISSKYNTILKSATDAIINIDNSDRIIECDYSALKLFGYDREEILGKNITDLIPSFNLKMQKEDLNNLNQKGIYRFDKKTIELSALKKNEDKFSCELSISSWKQNSLWYYLVFIRDISERKNQEEKINEQNIFLKLVMNSLTYPLYVINTHDYSIENANSASRFNPNSAINNCHQLFHNSDKPCSDSEHPCPMEIVLKTKSPTKVEHIHYNENGEIQNVEVHFFPMFNKQGNIKQVLGYCLDITEQKKIEKELQKSKEDFYSIVGRSDSGILVVDCDGIIKFINPATESLFKKDSSKLIGQLFGFPIESETPVELDIWHGKESPGVGEMSSKPTEWEGEKAYLVFIRDITLLKNTENNLRQLSIELQEKNNDLESYAHTVAHDLKNPVGAMLGLSELILTENLSIETIKKYNKLIYKSSSNLFNIINELLLFASLQKTEIKIIELDMKKIVEAAIKRTISEDQFKNITITYPDKWLISKGYAAWIEEVWKNYISNAIKYGGSPTKMEFGCEPIIKKGGGTAIKYWLKDFGPGISKKNQQLLFKKFERLDQAKADGHGLGLSIVKRIVNKLGGTTGVESELGKGSNFYFTLPVKTAIKTKTLEKIISRKTLIVENDKASDILLGALAKKFSEKVLHASNGLDAIKAFQEDPDIDLVLMDISMPEMDGYETTKKIRDFNTDVIIIAQTAFSMAKSVDKAMKAGCNDFITKPINGKHLIEIIEMQFKNKSNT